LHIKAFVRRVTLISCQAQEILDLQQATTQKMSAILPAHFTSQDILNEENGGITTISDFEDEDPNYDNRQRLEFILLMRNHF
jgi:hypothetical protein